MVSTLLGVESSMEVERRELVCGTCGYGVVVRHEPPECPMCRGSQWVPRRRGSFVPGRGFALAPQPSAAGLRDSGSTVGRLGVDGGGPQASRARPLAAPRRVVALRQPVP
jgi:hypothetical protein